MNDTLTEAELSPEAKALLKAHDKKIPLVEMFGPTIQGEGNVIGQQTYFLRFGLCDYKCAKCDSMHAVDPRLVRAHAQMLTQEEIYRQFIAFYKTHTTRWVTFSGGNPAIHDLSYLLDCLKPLDFKVNVETQGTMYRGWLNKVDNLTISPKPPGMGETHNHKQFMGFLDKVYENGVSAGEIPGTGVPKWRGPKLCVKIVVFDQIDLEFAADIFRELQNHPLFEGMDPTETFYLSLGNPLPPEYEPTETGELNHPTHEEHMQLLLQNYRTLYEDIQRHPVLRNVRFLPQWHFFVWGNENGH